MLRSLVYRVEQVFLIHRETSLALLHVAADPALSRDSDMVAGMLSAIQDFARDSFQTGDDSTLEEFRIGELQVWIASRPLRLSRGGDPRQSFARAAHHARGSDRQHSHLERFRARASSTAIRPSFESLRPELESCLRAQYAEKKGAQRPTRAWFILIVVAALVVAALIAFALSKARWSRFVRRLEAYPGIVVTRRAQHWFAPSQIAGLRDAAAVDPATIARDSGLDPTANRFRLERISRARRRLACSGVSRSASESAAGAQVCLKNGTLTFAGTPSLRMARARVRQQATLVPGVNSISADSAQVSYDRNSRRNVSTRASVCPMACMPRSAKAFSLLPAKPRIAGSRACARRRRSFPGSPRSMTQRGRSRRAHFSSVEVDHRKCLRLFPDEQGQHRDRRLHRALPSAG